jgi:hypothetical protein
MECQHVCTLSYIQYWLDVSGQLQAPVALLPEKATPERTEQECECISVTVWTSWRKEESLALLGIESRYIGSTAITKPYSDEAIQAPYMAQIHSKNINRLFYRLEFQ